MRDGLEATPPELARTAGLPETIEGWKALAEGLLTDQPCVFRRNLEISARYAWMYRHAPTLKWAGMAAFASFHVRLALYPFRIDTDRTGRSDIERSLRRRALLMEDVNTIRATNNAIYDDIFWAHLAYAASEDGIGRLRALVDPGSPHGPILAGFEAIDRGRRSSDHRSIWQGNVQLLEHEQRALVQPNFDRLSCAYARLFSFGSALSFEARGLRQEASYFSSFYTYSFGRGIPAVVRSRAWPRVTRFEDRWRWILASIVPRFQRFDADTRVVDAKLRRILDHVRGQVPGPAVLDVGER